MFNKLLLWIANKRGLDLVNGILIAQHEAKNITSFYAPIMVINKEGFSKQFDSIEGLVFTKGDVIKIYYCN